MLQPAALCEVEPAHVPVGSWAHRAGRGPQVPATASQVALRSRTRTRGDRDRAGSGGTRNHRSRRRFRRYVYSTPVLAACSCSTNSTSTQRGSARPGGDRPGPAPLDPVARPGPARASRLEPRPVFVVRGGVPRAAGSSARSRRRACVLWERGPILGGKHLVREPPRARTVVLVRSSIVRSTLAISERGISRPERSCRASRRSRDRRPRSSETTRSDDALPA